jgi:hypothetical protein
MDPVVRVNPKYSMLHVAVQHLYRNSSRRFASHAKNTTMYLVVIAWLYVALMMAVAEATNPIGTVLGALVTFVLYGALPVSLVIYLMRTPQRKRERKAREMAELEAAATAQEAGGSVEPDRRGEAPGDPVAPVRKED